MWQLLRHFIIENWLHPWQLVRYLVGGLSAYVLDLSTSYLLYHYAHIPAGLTPIVQAPVVVTYAFLVQKYFTFRNRTFTKKQLFRYACIIVENNLITSIGLFLLVQVLHINFIVAKFLIMFVVVANNFPLFKLWVFK